MASHFSMLMLAQLASGLILVIPATVVPIQSSNPVSRYVAQTPATQVPGTESNAVSLYQLDIIKAIENEDYDRAASLATEAHQRQEFAVVLNEILGKSVENGTDGNRSKSGNEDSFALLLNERPKPTLVRQIDALCSSFTNIMVSELGDKTFIVAAIMAGLYPRELVLAGALAALALMTVLSVAAGFALPILLPRRYTHPASVAAFALAGAKLLYDAREMRRGAPSGALQAVEAHVFVETGSGRARGGAGWRWWMLHPVMVQAFVQTFLAEWGDRSQIATIALAAHKDAGWVMVGSVAGHALCTTLAVVGGRMVASRIPERTMATAGGLVFLIIAAHGWRQGDSSLINS